MGRAHLLRAAVPSGSPYAGRQLRGMGIAALGILVLSFDSLLVRISGAGAWEIVFWRGLLVALSLGAITLVSRRSEAAALVRQGGAPALACVLLFGIDSALFVLSVMHTRVANTVVILSAAPLFAGLFTWLFLREGVAPRTWAAIAAAVAGVLLVFAGSVNLGGLTGDALALTAAVLAAANLTVLRRFPYLPRIPMVAASGLITALIAVPFAEPLVLGAQAYAALAVMGLVQMPAAMVLMAVATRYLSAPEVSLFLLVETVLAPVWVYLAVGEEPPPLTFAGGALILAAIAVHSWLSLRRAGSVIAAERAKDEFT